MSCRYGVTLAWLSLVGLLLPLPTRCQAVRVSGGRAKIALTTGDTLTLSASPAAIGFSLQAGGTAAGSAPLVITTQYTGASLLSSLSLYAYFGSAQTALSGGLPATSIPTSCVLGQVMTGTPKVFTPFTQPIAGGPSGAGLMLYQSSALLGLSGQRVDTLSLEINLTSLPQLPAGVYQGVLSLQLQAF